MEIPESLDFSQCEIWAFNGFYLVDCVLTKGCSSKSIDHKCYPEILGGGGKLERE